MQVVPRVVYLAAILAALVLATAVPEALAEHVQCGDVITQDTKLDSDLVECPRNGIVIGADGITIDLNGHTIDGDRSQNLEPCDVGMLNGPELTLHCPQSTMPGRHDVTVRNGFIRDFDVGVNVREASRNRLRGLTISGSHYAGVIVAESDETSIERNLLKDNWSFAGVLNFGDATGIRVIGNVVSGNSHSGTESDGIYDSRFERNSFIGNRAGIHLHAVHNNQIVHNWMTDNGIGIELSDGAFDNRVFGNWVVRNTSIGIMTQEGDHRNRIERNFVVGNGSQSTSDSAGIHIFGDGDGGHVEGNVLIGNDRGVVVSGTARHVEIVRNWIFRNTRAGIVLRNPEHMSSVDRVALNSVIRNGGDGIFIDGAIPFGTSRYIVERNVARQNEDDGIDTEYPATELVRNTVSANGDLGIEAVPGVTDGGGNRAFGNGNPLQCLNVICK